MSSSTSAASAARHSAATRAVSDEPTKFAKKPTLFLDTGVKEASDLQYLGTPGGDDEGVLVVGDLSDKLFFCGMDGRVEKIDLPGVAALDAQFEGVVTYAVVDPEDAQNTKNRLVVSSEGSGTLYRFKWSADGAPVLKEEIDVRALIEGATGQAMGKLRNKGVEALGFMDPSFSPTGSAEVLFALEGNLPKGQGKALFMLLDRGDGKLGGADAVVTMIRLDEKVLDLLDDIAGLVVDSSTGHVFILSQERALVVEVQVVREGDSFVAKYLGQLDVVNDRGEKLARAESLGLDGGGNLLVQGENSGKVYRHERRG